MNDTLTSIPLLVIGLDIALSSRYPTVYDGSLTAYEVTALRANTSYRLVVIPRTSAGLGIDCFIDITTLDVTSSNSDIPIDSCFSACSANLLRL